MAGIGNAYVRFARYSADLCLFLLVADCRQLSRAAVSAGLSQPRLSQRMKFLEDSLGQPLFLRQRRGVVLTPAGQKLYDLLSGPLTGASDALDSFRQAAHRKSVVIQTDLAFASFRFLPVFPSLCAAFSDLSISLLTTQLPEDAPGADVDLIVRMEPPDQKGPPGRPLFPEKVFAVCSPVFKARHGTMHNPADLLDKPLVDLVTRRSAPWLTWSGWFENFGLTMQPHAERLMFNSYDHVIRSAEDGLGVALGWQGLVDDRLESGRLVRAVETEVETTTAYVARTTVPRPRPEVVAVLDWILARMKQ